MRGSFALIVGVLSVLAVDVARADFIGPGHEAEITEAVARAAAATPAVTVDGIAVERDVLVVHAHATDEGRVSLVVRSPRTGAERPTVTHEGEGPTWVRFADALATELATIAPQLWLLPRSEPSPPRPLGPRATLAPLAFACVLVWMLGRLAVGLFRRRPEGLVSESMLVAGLVGVFVGVATAVPAWGPLQDHNTFVARNDCAFAGDCDDSPAGGWAPTIFHLYGPILRALPVYDEHAIESLGLTLSALALGLVYVFTRLLVTPHVPRPRAIRIAALAFAFAAFHPLVLRLSVSDTFWPFTMCLVFGAGVLALVARDDGRIDTAVAAAALLGFATVTSYAMIGLLALVLAPFAWGTRRPRPVTVVLVFTTLALVAAPDVVTILRTSIANAVLSGVSRGVAARQLVAFHPLFVSVVSIAAALVGGVTALRGRATYLLPSLVAFFVTWFPAAGLNEWQSIHPSRLMFTFSEVLFLSVLPAFGLDAAAEALQQRKGERPARALLAGALVTMVLSTPFAREGWSFLFERDTLARELDAIEAMLPRLPAHDVFVFPDVIQETRRDLPIGSDPVEVAYPLERHRAAMARRGRPVRVLLASELLASPAEHAGYRVLVYSGVSHRTFVVGEIAAGIVPESLEREQLRRLRDLGELRPVLLERIAIKDHPARSMRVMADRAPSMDVGFYELAPRVTGSRPSRSVPDAARP